MKTLNTEKIMRIITFIIFFLIIIFFFQNNQSLFDRFIDEATQEQKNIHVLISPQEYKTKLDSEEYIHIDIRTQDEHNQEKISKSLLIDFNSPNFKEELSKLDKNKKYLYYYYSGGRSRKATFIFEELKFKEIYMLDGGISKSITI